MRRLTLVACVLACCALVLSCRAASAPISLQAEWGNLEGPWLFRTDPHEIGEKQGWQRTDIDDTSWRRIKVPGWWEPQGITQPRPGRPPTPKGKLPWTDYDGVAWYRLHVIVPRQWAGQELVLRLGSVDDFDRTYFNGRLVGETGLRVKNAVAVHRTYRIAPEAVRYGEENVIAVRVTDGGGPGGIMGPAVSLLPRSLAEQLATLPGGDRPLKERFANPPAECRILKIVHSLPDEPEAQDRVLRDLVLCGFGGAVCNVSFEDYLRSEQKWQAFVRGVKQAKKLGMALWLYDERGYPSGVAGGLVLQGHPEWQAMGLLIVEASTDQEGHVEIDLPPGELVMAAALACTDQAIDPRRRQDLRSSVHGRKLIWDAPGGRWLAMVITRDYLYEGTHAQLSLGDRLPYINLLLPEPTARFIQVTHEAYAAHLGTDLGKYFISTFTDEPSLMSMFLRPMPYRVLPWAPNLPEEFEKRRGYELVPNLPLLVADGGGLEKKVRYDFWLTVAELVSENYFGQIERWCREHNLASGGHLLMEEHIADHVPLYGDAFRCLRRLSAPSIDCLTSIPGQVPWHIARLASSAAALEGNRYVMCETSDFAQRYRPEGDTRPVRTVTEEEIRGTCNRLILGGVTTITSYYSFTGLDLKALQRLNLWVGRCSTMLTGGHQVTDIAVLYPIESLWVRHRPARYRATSSAAARAVGQLFGAASDVLYANRRDFTYVDSRALAEASVEPPFLRHGELRWRVVILPGVDTLPMSGWRALLEFWRTGGVVIAVGHLPANSERRFPDPEVEGLSEAMFGEGDQPRIRANKAGGVAVFLPRGAEGLLAGVLDRIIGPDVSVRDRNSPLRITHRHIDGSEVYFVVNDSANPVTTAISVSAEGKGELWDPGTGKVESVESPKDIKLSLAPYGGVLLRFSRAVLPRRHSVASGSLPGLAIKPLPIRQPSLGKGEFVEGKVEQDAQHTTATGPAWRATGRLTKGGVDTFLFLSFDYEPPLDMSGASCLVLDSWVPAGSNTSASLLVILGDRDGGDYIAQAGRSLDEAGHARTYVPLSQFRLAPWSDDPNGRLDTEGIAAVRVGWGGYYGEEGEVVEFSLAMPQMAVLGEGED